MRHSILISKFHAKSRIEVHHQQNGFESNHLELVQYTPLWCQLYSTFFQRVDPVSSRLHLSKNLVGTDVVFRPFPEPSLQVYVECFALQRRFITIYEVFPGYSFELGITCNIYLCRSTLRIINSLWINHSDFVRSDGWQLVLKVASHS